MASAKNTTFTIVQGPDRFDILKAYAEYSPDRKFRPETMHTAYFVTKDGKRDSRFYVAVSGLQHEDGSGKSWNIEGYMVWVDPMPMDYEQLSRRVVINYRVDKKTGSLRILAK